MRDTPPVVRIIHGCSIARLHTEGCKQAIGLLHLYTLALEGCFIPFGDTINSYAPVLAAFRMCGGITVTCHGKRREVSAQPGRVDSVVLVRNRGRSVRAPAGLPAAPASACVSAPAAQLGLDRAGVPCSDGVEDAGSRRVGVAASCSDSVVDCGDNLAPKSAGCVSK